ncbi:MAG: ATP-binding protein [Planctomycetia bacterium]
MAKLRVLKGPDAGKVFELSKGVNMVGRDAKCIVRLQDTEISRNHAELFWGPEGFRLRDLGSFNGSHVNCKQVKDILLKTGDQLQVGQTVMLFVYEEQAPSEIQASIFSSEIAGGSEKDKLLQKFSILGSVPDSEGSVILSRPQGVEGDWVRNALSRLGVVYEAITATSEILELGDMLGKILKLLLSTLEADHASVYLFPEFADSEYGLGEQIQSENNSLSLLSRIGDNPAKMGVSVSKTVVDYVLREKQGVLVSDALKDSRFNAVQSIVRAGVREIICVPMKGRHSTVGVIYLDKLYNEKHSDTVGVHSFVKEHLILSIAVAHQAALAVEETHHYQARLQSERLAAVGEAVAYLSHHIKNILQGLKSGGEILRMGIKDLDASLLSSAEKLIDKNHGRLFDLVKDMLSFSKNREPNYEDCDLVKLLADIAELSSPMVAAKGGVLKFESFAEELGMFIDQEGIHRVVLNLLNNALDACQDVDVPVIGLSLVEGDLPGWIKIMVRDNGEGISSQEIEKIFQPFKSSKGNAGTGLGLAVAQKIVKEHQGRIDLASDIGAGAVFSISLPIRRNAL